MPSHRLTDSFSAEELEALRADTPGCRGHIHFNNAGAALMPAPVLEAAQAHLRLEAEIGGYEAAAARSDAIAAFYDATAQLLGCRPENIAHTANATDAYSRALSAIPFEPGDVLVTTRNDYISNQIAFLSLHRRLGVEIVHAPDAAGGRRRRRRARGDRQEETSAAGRGDTHPDELGPRAAGRGDRPDLPRARRPVSRRRLPVGRTACPRECNGSAATFSRRRIASTCAGRAGAGSCMSRTRR